ncbi:MAG: hypothetical protein KatS3mg034_0863 [Vicingaceae bacterium]|jgi:hypothetical protein|nr:MAG: hypothetical protein KatS3mg034_0863 [Vicingaceae bacterium]
MNILCKLNSKTEKNNLRRISLSDHLQNQLSKYLSESINFFYKAKQIKFDGEYKPNENEVLEINNFDFPLKDYENIINLPLLKEEEIYDIKHIIFLNKESIIFQTFDSRKIIKTEKLYLIYSSETFSKIDNKGLIIDAKIDAMFLKNEDKLLFTSYHNASKIFDLSKYFREATDKEINIFKRHTIFKECDNIDYSIINSRYRKKIFQIIKNGVLNKVQDNFNEVIKYARELELPNMFDESESKILFPQEKKDIEKLINFLNDDLYKSPISKFIYETNSKRKMENK